MTTPSRGWASLGTGTSVRALCVVCKNNDEAERWSASTARSEVEQLTIINNGRGVYGGYGRVGQHVLDIVRMRSDAPEWAFGLVHGDTEFAPGALATFYDEAAPGLQVASGIVGRASDKRYVWCKNPNPVAYDLNAVREGGEVDCFDGCAIFFPVAPPGEVLVSFDLATFPGFHCVVEDIALTLRARGYRLMVPRAEAYHRASKPSAQWLVEYASALDRLKRKHRDISFRTT